MKRRLAIFMLSVVLGSQVMAAERKSRKKGGGPLTLPPTSAMLQISAVPDSSIQAIDANGLINTQLGGRDLDFFRTLIEAGQLQALLGNLVKSKAESEQVKTLGGALFSSQAEENRQIIHLAELNGIAPAPDSSGGPRRISAELEKLSGSSFDIACADGIVRAIQQAVRAYEEGAESKIEEVKSFAEQMLPISRERLRVAEKMLVSGSKAPPSPEAPAFHSAPVIKEAPASGGKTGAPPKSSGGSGAKPVETGDQKPETGKLPKSADINGIRPIPLATPSLSASTPTLSTPAPFTLAPVATPIPLLATPAPASPPKR